jgi:hypothetical protein
MTAEELEDFIESKPLAQRRAGDGSVRDDSKPGNPTGHNQFTPKEELLSNNNSEKGRKCGTSARYIVERLKRDAPDVAEALARGEYPSARAAGIAAGIVKVLTKLEAAKKAYLKLSPEEKNRFLGWAKKNNGS